jgi:hypothetical protein
MPDQHSGTIFNELEIMQKTKVHAFQIASLFMIVLGIVHPILHFMNKDPVNEVEAEIFRLMSTYQKPMMGGAMSMTDVLDGLNVCYGIFFLLIGAFNLLSFHRLRNNFSFVISICRLESIFFLAIALTSLVYFYWVPVAYAFFLGCCFTWIGFGRQNN